MQQASPDALSIAIRCSCPPKKTPSTATVAASSWTSNQKIALPIVACLRPGRMSSWSVPRFAGRMIGMIRFQLVLVSVLALLVTSCDRPQNGGDASPPDFLSLSARYVRVSDGLEVGQEDVSVAGFSSNVIGQSRRLELVAVAGDSDSGIVAVERQGEMVWTCVDLGSDLATRRVATLDRRSDEVRAGGGPTGTTLGVGTFTVDPFGGNPQRLICPRAQEQSPVVLTTTITARNGAGLTVTTGPLVFYLGRAPAALKRLRRRPRTGRSTPARQLPSISRSARARPTVPLDQPPNSLRP
jgi:hypothetical protein